ncbi:unnamed protein product [Haemonchus placei]|uniref:Late nodulin n=1 Tax=Haemonchus placei TaxID=6290 RepID=A0A0N4W0P6_HAEPC|nr:unnamed protein product [Haemonchus placei]
MWKQFTRKAPILKIFFILNMAVTFWVQFLRYGKCQPGHTCYFEQCVPQGLRFKRDTAVGPCIAGLCPSGYFCHQQECLKR